jgi:hypothetical protein
MHKPFGQSLFLFVILGVAAMACADESDRTRSAASVTVTTSADLSRNSAAGKIAATRCLRAAQCNMFGPGAAMYTDKDECIDRETSAAMSVAAGCTYGVSVAGLDKCLGMLDGEFCGADLGPVTTMPECRNYCRKAP